MFRKTLLALMIMVGFAASPQKTQASVPIGDIVKGAKAAKEIYDLAQPLLVRCGKAIKKGCKKIVNFIKRHRGNRANDVYVNPLRTAAVANEEEFEVIIRRRYGHGEIDIDIDGEVL